MGKFEYLTRHIPELQRDTYGTWIVDREHAGTAEDPLTMPYVNYSETVYALQNDTYAFCDAHPEYDSMEYQQTLRDNGLEWSMDAMSEADVSALDDNAILALLLGAYRAERFCDGALLSFFENGSILRWLKRLEELDAEKPLSTITIQKTDITTLDLDCIVNAANSGLLEGGGVCGAIFAAAGSRELQKACDAYGGCPVGSAVITPGFRLKAKYIIHAVGPIWKGGTCGERDRLAGCYQAAMKLAMENGCHTIAFPLISSGIYGYPKKEAWTIALQTVQAFQKEHDDYELDVTFAVLSGHVLELGKSVLAELTSCRS